VGSGSTNNDIVGFTLNRFVFQAGLTSPFAVTGNAVTMDRFGGGSGAQPQIRMGYGLDLCKMVTRLIGYDRVAHRGISSSP
jgi:hypothetical protein